MTTDRSTIYVAGYPKSGTTWLTRLLGDALNSPTGASVPKDDRNEPATEGKDRPGPYVVRKGHFVLVDDEYEKVVPAPHRLAWRNVLHEKVVLIARDPRDIAVSGAHHWNTTPVQFLDHMIRGTGGVRSIGSWSEYMYSWWQIYGRLDFALVRYEDLLRDTRGAMVALLTELDIDVAPLMGRLKKAIARQSFEAKKKWIKKHPNIPLGVDFNLRFMRKGQAGDWRNHFGQDVNRYALRHFGEMMRAFGYLKGS